MGSLSTFPEPSHQSLVDLLAAAVAQWPERVAVEDESGALTYREVDALSDRVRDRLRALGVGPGHRVGIYLHKSIDAYASVLGSLKCGAAYVPVDHAAPPWRAAYILNDCQVAAVVLEADLLPAWESEARKLGALPPGIIIEAPGGGASVTAALDALDAVSPAASRASERPAQSDLAYILYTSGSTGRPKGVMLTNLNAISYVDWCVERFAPNENDRFSSHAPFHFDLSILDLYVPIRVGAAVVLIGTDQGKEPQGLAALIADRRLTIWYSTPTILSLLTQYGKMERHDYTALRIAFFAGEVFPVKHLRSIVQRWPHVRFYNLYGPTETNVCTWHPIPAEIPDDRTVPYPIGRTCSHFDARVVDEAGRDVARGSEGELVMHGLGTMSGYWNLPERSANAFFVGDDARRWYRTGDVVTEDAGGVFTYVGRRDRMVKRRGYRIELGEIESALYRHAAIREAAVISSENGAGVKITAFVCLEAGQERSIVGMKRFCADVLPNYMSPDSFLFIDALPKTSTDKVDYQRLAEQL